MLLPENYTQRTVFGHSFLSVLCYLQPQDLKKRIESLIDREYLERDENCAK
jgi:hypothetical protein